MSSATSAIPDELDFDTCVIISNGRITKEIFDKYKNDERELFPKKILIELNQKTDCFLTHDWYIHYY
jgi:hypothetical protein